MSRSLSLIVFLLLSLSAQTAELKGIAKGLEGRELYLVRTVDFLSEAWEVIEQTTVADDGSFAFAPELESTTLLSLYAGPWRADVYLRPDQDLEIRLEAGTEGRAMRFSDNRMELQIVSPGPDDPNWLLDQFNRRYLNIIGESTYDLARFFTGGGRGFRSLHSDDLAATNMVTLAGDSLTTADKKALIDSVDVRFSRLHKEMNELLQATDDSVTHRLVHAAMGQLDLMLGLSEAEAARLYVAPDASNMKNPEMVQLLAMIHGQIESDEAVNVKLLRNAVLSGDLAKARDALVNYPTYLDGQGVDLVLLMYAKAAIGRSAEMKSGAIRLFEAIAKGEGNAAAIAGRLLDEALQGTVRDANFLPDITLVNHKSERINLTELNDQPFLLSVVKLGSAACERELMLLEDLHRKYGRQIRFVTLVMDAEPDVLRNYLAAHPAQEWDFLLGGGHPALRKSMDLVTIPRFFMVMPTNRLYKKFTVSPSEGLERDLKKLVEGDRREFNPWLDRQ